MKKLLLILLVMIYLSGCGPSNTPGDTPSGGTAPTSTPTLTEVREIPISHTLTFQNRNSGEKVTISPNCNLGFCWVEVFWNEQPEGFKLNRKYKDSLDFIPPANGIELRWKSVDLDTVTINYREPWEIQE